jgi:hypothetical protein
VQYTVPGEWLMGKSRQERIAHPFHHTKSEKNRVAEVDHAQ